MAVRVYIVEDEPLISATITVALKKHGFTILGDTDNTIDAKREIGLFQPDLVLVDIQLEGEDSGINLARDLEVLRIPYFYLTSQTDPKTLAEVKSTNPLGYIVKPFTEAGLRSSIEVGWNTYQKTEPEYLIFNHEGAKLRINQDQIIYLEAFDNYCYVYTKQSKYLLPKTLKSVSESLNPEKILKIHRSYWVNPKYITSVGASYVIMGSITLPLSNSRRTEVLEKFTH